MLVLCNDHLELSMQADGTDVLLWDAARNVAWRLDESTRLTAREVARHDTEAYAEKSIASPAAKVKPLGPGSARKLGETVIACRHRSASGEVILRWALEQDQIRVTAEPSDGAGATALALPGTFRPENEKGFLSAIPNGQGILHTGKGPAFYRPLNGKGGAWGFTLSMFGQIAERGALVSMVEDDADVVLHWEKTRNGSVRLMWLQHPSMGGLSYPREVILTTAGPDLTSVCKRFRRHVREKGCFKSWAEKLRERPQLEKLFGAAIVFVGYHHDPDLDYAAGFRRLKQMGIDRAYVFPIFMASTLDMGTAMGVRLTDLRQHLPLLDELGYAAGSFLYIMDGPKLAGPDPCADLFLDREGHPILKWTIKDLNWFMLSISKRMEWSRYYLDRDHAGLSGVHYDVLATTALREDHHPARLMDARADRENRKALLQSACDRGLIVSSEGFWDHMTPSYDLGNSKYAHALGGEEYCVVPMTMLVYHDSAFHVWWEVDNYNNPEHRSQGGRGWQRRFAMGGGFPQPQAAMDALMGTPPDIFPFGMQYNYVPHNHPQFYLYKFRLEDAAVLEAIECAKPVMALHRRIGKLEMIAHKLHRPDGAIQEAIFADGTRVIANFANVALEAPGAGRMAPESWKCHPPLEKTSKYEK
ncbi:MAG: hypothetical protein HY360_04965 [Verrucomicrobia bacterium]|nr:hypothetical protein [Verrucomicrobiota bacterium]